jgi:hypothetical protein
VGKNGLTCKTEKAITVWGKEKNKQTFKGKKYRKRRLSRLLFIGNKKK